MLLLALLACQPAPTDEVPDQTSGPFVPDVATGGCGAPAYDWAQMARMGEIVDWEVAAEATLSAQTIDGLLAVAGVEGFPPATYGARVYRVRYLTQDRGQEIEATGLLSWPDVDEPADFPTLLWVHPTSGFTDACAPSAGPFENELASVLFAAQGFAVAAPDYLGMNGWGEPAPFLHPYLVPEPTAVASLDSVRALWAFQDQGLDGALEARATTTAVIWGASEGGAAALWSDRYAAHYLPELEIRGTIAQAAPTDLRGLALHGVSAFDDTTAGLAAVLTTSRPWYGNTAPLDEVLTDAEPTFLASQIEAALGASCDPGDLFDGVDSVDEVYQPAFAQAVIEGRWGDLEPWSCILDTAMIGPETFERGHDAPVLYTIGEDDTLVDADLQVADVPRLCGLGYDLEVLRCAGQDHVGGIAATLPYALGFAQALIAGDPVQADCVVPEPVTCDSPL